ncbi:MULTISPECIES: hypothetical protein [unclassified Arsukibacterium]|uniref:hypothetical protein n=1 Tax=unclassified Arsukibacterium TaxID=2635278 RepID=UPI000C982F4E|nr:MULTISPECIES: hypothetical protein [unclassified Arsukibacterium]MAA93576.1 hypothetical protein [Rheinheimera sp.]HAW94390.1 hypothetical protein [Candidatus Azambacteria bacterium]|tara:strand:+ start:10423 stop:10908 length:486 start_codon:yes stop_codon:yes gene_type:complete
MRFTLIFFAFLISFQPLANDSIAEKVCNAYKNEDDRKKCFSELKEQELIETAEILPPAKYITFKWGSSACRDIKYWQQAIERTFSKDPQAFRDVDNNCKYLREATVVYGVLQKEFHISTELAQIKASDGHTYWIELPAVLPITSERETRPDNWTTDLRELN